MLRPPSLQKTYDEYCSLDPAFEQPANDATDEQLEAHANRVRIARETGNWTGLLIEGGQPTKFEMRLLPGHLFRRMQDMAMSGRDGRPGVGVAEMGALLFRAALVNVSGLDDTLTEVEFVTLPTLGRIADNAVPDRLDALDKRIVTELGNEVARRASTIAPKL